MKQRDVILQSKTQDGEETIDFPITTLSNIESSAEIKTNPTAQDYIPIIDSEDNAQMKKTPFPVASDGQSAGFGDITAEVDNSIGNPSVSVTTSGDNSAKNILFQFSGLKGEKGEDAPLTHINDTTVHVTADEKASWNSKSNFSGSYTDLTNKPTIPVVTEDLYTNTSDAAQAGAVINELNNYLYTSLEYFAPIAHTSDNTAHITAAERDAWNGKAAGNHNHDTAYAPKSHSDNSTIHVTAEEKASWNSKAAGSHTHSASDITSGTLPVSRGGTGVTSTFTSFTFTKSHSSFGAHWGQIFYCNYLGMAYLNIAISVNAVVNAGAVKIGSVDSSYKPQTRTQLAASLSRGHAFINTDGSITVYSEINFSSGTPVCISGWYRVAS